MSSAWISIHVLGVDPLLVPSVRTTVHDSLINCLVTVDHRLVFGIDRVETVSLTMGRFIDKDMQQIVVDEPVCLVAGARRFLGENISISDVDFYLSSEPQFQNRFSATSLMALCLTHVFSEPRSLADLFVFPGTKPEWAAQTADLVSLDGQDAQPFYYTPGTFKRLAHVSKSREDTLAWLKHEHKTVFCISSIESSAPVLLFALKLADGSLIWVFLSVRLDGTAEEPLAESEVRDALANLQPERVLCENVSNQCLSH